MYDLDHAARDHVEGHPVYGGVRIRRWRKATGKPARIIAKLFGCSRIQLFRLETGARAITADMAVIIETKTGRDIPRSALRPDLWPSEAVAA